MKKRLIAFLLVLCMTVGYLPLTAMAADDQQTINLSVAFYYTDTETKGEPSYLKVYRKDDGIYDLTKLSVKSSGEPADVDLSKWSVNDDSYELAGWNTSANIENEPLLFTEKLTVDGSSNTAAIYLYMDKYHKVSYDYQNDELNTVVQVKHGTSVGNTMDPGPERAIPKGHSGFSHWVYSGGTNNGQAFTGASIVNEDTNVKAVWKPYSYKLTCMNGDTAVQEQTVAYGGENFIAENWNEENGKYTFTAPNAPAGDETEFLGWSATKNSATVEYKAGAPIEVDKDSSIILYAVWAPKQYTLSYDANGGEELDTEVFKAQTGLTDTSFTIPAAQPTHSDSEYYFAGWNTAADGTGTAYKPEDTFTVGTADTILYAQWGVYKTVTFNNSDGTRNKTVLVKQGATVGEDMPDDPTTSEEGKHFAGWFDGDSEFESDTVVNDDITVTARFDPNVYKVTFDADGGKFAEEEQTAFKVEHGKDLADEDVPDDPTKEHYTFKGWDGSYKEVKSDVTIKAKWEGEPCKVTFDDDDETTTDQTVTVPYGSTLGDLMPEKLADREGEKFDDWYVGDVKFDKDTVVDNTALTVKAKFVPKTYTVTFTAPDGMLAEDAKTEYTLNHGDNSPEAPKFVDTSVHFAGWFDQDGNEYRAERPVTRSLTVTAKYQYIITFQSGDNTKLVYVDPNGTLEGKVPADLEVPADPEGEEFKGWFTDLENPETELKEKDPVTGKMTFHAKFGPKVYNYTFKAGDGYFAEGDEDGDGEIIISVEYGKKPESVPKPVRDFYKFEGWDKLIPDEANGNMEFDAIWIGVDCTVTFDLDGGKFPNSTETKFVVKYGNTIDKMPEDPVKDGYIFDRWQVTDKTPAPKGRAVENETFDGDTIVDGHLTVTAQWKQGYTVKYVHQVKDWEDTQEMVTLPLYEKSGLAKGDDIPVFDPSGDGKADTPKYLDANGKEVAGWAFEGWNTKADGTGKSVEEYGKVDGDVYFYAQWTPDTNCDGVGDIYQYILAFYSDDYNQGDTFLWHFSYQTSNKFPIPMDSKNYPNPKKDGYAFMGWAEKPGSTKAEYQGGDVYTVTNENKMGELFAVWAEDKNGNGKDDASEPRYTVVYNDGDPLKGIFATQTYRNILVGMPTPAFQGTPTRTGYEFTGWEPEVADTVTKSVTYKATWKKVVSYVTVTFIDRDEQVDEITLEKGDEIGNKNMPDVTRKGYTLRWYTQKNGKGSRFRGTTNVYEDMTVYAHWVKNDGTNAKTGDTILVWVAVMAVAAIGIAGVAVYAAKRKKK